MINIKSQTRASLFFLCALFSTSALAQANPWPDETEIQPVAPKPIKSQPSTASSSEKDSGELSESPAPVIAPTSSNSAKIYLFQPSWWPEKIPRWILIILGWLLAYLLGLPIYRPLLDKGWSPAGAAWFAMFLSGLFVSLVLPYTFAEKIFVQGFLVPWYQQLNAWLWSFAHVSILIVVGLIAYITRPTSHHGQENLR